MVADLPVTTAPPDSLLAAAGRWAGELSPRERSRLAAAGFVTMGLSVLVAPGAPLACLGTASLGAAALTLATWGVVTQAVERRPRPALRLLARGAAALLAGTIGVAVAAFLLALLGKPWIS